MENTKRGLSLDFTKPRHPRGQQAPSLVTPILNLSTPELHKMISEDEQLTDLTPNTISAVIPQPSVLPSPLIPTTVNSNIIMNHSCSNNNYNANNNSNNNISNGNTNCNNNNGNHNSHMKRSDKQGRDVDIEKIEKKRERNRLAAKKCRQRKLETIDELRKTVSEWEQKYQRLEMDFEHFKTVRSKELEALIRENTELKSMIQIRGR